MIQRLILFCAIFTITFCFSNKSDDKYDRFRRSYNDNFECGVPYRGTGLMSGGSEVHRGEFPWLVAMIHIRKGYICSGTMISSTKVVTAAHCIHNKYQTAFSPRELLLLFGAHDIDKPYETDRVEKRPSKVILHKQWNPSELRYSGDIAVLVLDSEVQFSNFIRPICLMSDDFGITDGVVAAWGKDDTSERDYENLPKKLNIPIIPDGACFRENSGLIDISWSESFCAGRRGVGVCTGDSGGGFYVKYNARFYFKGLVSSTMFSDTGCYTENYAIYTDVVKYSSFIGGEQSLKETCGVMSSEPSSTSRENFATRFQFPWLVSISLTRNYVDYEHSGSGSLITTRHVVSHAKAVAWANTNNRYVAFTTNFVKLYFATTMFGGMNDEGAIEVDQVEKISIHPSAVHSSPRKFNVAVTTMIRPIEISSMIRPVCLAVFTNRNEIGNVAYDVGYHLDTNRGYKKYSRVTIDGRQRCLSYWREKLNRSYPSKHFCATGSKSHALFSDEQLFIKIDGKWYLRGMMSLSDTSTARNESPNLYEDISVFAEWIVKETQF